MVQPKYKTAYIKMKINSTIKTDLMTDHGHLFEQYIEVDE